MRIVIFSPSARKVWVQPINKILNPSYWIIAYLASRLADDHEVYTVSSSMSPVGNVKPYRGEAVDVIISLGASYNPETLKSVFNRGYSFHDRAFEIGDVTRRIMTKYKPLHVNLCVDVRPWFDNLTEIFGSAPNHYITEQEMKWQAIGYTINSQLSQMPKTIPFFFSGGIKARHERFLELTRDVKGMKVIHGGGWDKYLKVEDGYDCHGFQQWWDSVRVMNSARFSLTLHEPEGNAQGWITAKLFENMGCNVVTFVDSHYDRYNLYVPKDSVLRVYQPGDIQHRIDSYGYETLLAEQKRLINPQWSDLESFYVVPFKKRFNDLING